MEMKGPQTNTAGFSFDADKQSEAEQNRRTKVKKSDWKQDKKILSPRPVVVGGKTRGSFGKGSVWEQGFQEESRRESGSPRGCDPGHSEPPMQAWCPGHGCTSGDPELEKKRWLWG